MTLGSILLGDAMRFGLYTCIPYPPLVLRFIAGRSSTTPAGDRSPWLIMPGDLSQKVV